MKDFIEKLPKAELHLHIEGTFEPELMFEIAARNNIKLPYKSIEELKQAYDFNNLQEFLDLYYEACNVLLHEQDFYDLTYAYLQKAHQNNIVHAEIMFDPQTHTERGVDFATVITGIHKALEAGLQDFGISSKLILSILRHLDEKAALEILEIARPYHDWIDAIGLDSSELGNPPSKFQNFFRQAKAAGFFVTVHAGEEGPSDYIWEALNLLQVDRIDHGNRSLDDEKLVQKLSEEQIALTVCPLSNLKLKVVKDLRQHPLKQMLEKGLFVNINSDDPAYFGGYLNENFIQIQKSLDLNRSILEKLAKNSIEASMLSTEEKKQLLAKFQ
ncbi:MAG: adenosine deaminase [Candidatus Cloacimonadales bacterium]